MASISSTGVGSGLDINSLVTQLVAAERAPVESRLTKTDARLTSEFTALSKLKSAMSGFQSALAALKTPAAFDTRKAKVGDEEIFTASVSSRAAPGSYDVEVRQLAASARAGSQLFVNGAQSVVGSGSLTIAVGNKSTTIQIAADDTLAEVRDAINAAPGNSSVRASLITDTGGSGSYLVLTGSATGAANGISVSATGADAGLTQLVQALNDFDAVRDVAAQDAIVRVSGYEIHASSNVIGGAIDGVTLNLAKADQGNLVSLTVERDDAVTLTRAQGFVTAYNALAQQVKALGAYDAATKTAGPMLGDSMLRGIETQLRKLLSEPVAGTTAPYTTLATLGIALTTGGTLELDSAKFNTAMTADPGAVGRVFASTSGVAVKLDAFVAQKLSSAGEFASRNSGVTSRRKDLEKQRDALDARMEVIQARYMKQFTALDSMLSQLQSTSSYLSQQLTSLSNLNK